MGRNLITQQTHPATALKTVAMFWPILFGLLLSGCGNDINILMEQPQKPGELIVMFKPEVANYGNTTNQGLLQLLKRFYPEQNILKYSELLWQNRTGKKRSIISKIRIPTEIAVGTVIKKLSNLPFIQSVQPNFYSRFYQDKDPIYLSSAENETGANTNNNENNNINNGVKETPAATKQKNKAGITVCQDASTDYIPSDSDYLSYQKFIYEIVGIPSAWSMLFALWPTKDCTPDQSVKDKIIGVAVLDSGVALYHEDLQEKLFVNYLEYSGEIGVDDDDNGYIDDFNGVNVNNPRSGIAEEDEDASPNDLNSCNGEESDPRPWTSERKIECLGTIGHGTHVAGIIAAKIDSVDENGGGSMAGICPNCRILPVRITDGTGDIPDDNIIKGLEYVEGINAHKSPYHVQIVNLSIGKRFNSLAIEEAIHRISDKVLVVAAASNDDTEQPSYPAALPDVLSVSAIGGPSTSGAWLAMQDGSNKEYYEQKASFSNFGNHIDLVAPGQNIWSTAPYQFESGIGAACHGVTHCMKSGTSQAAPFVSGIAGMVMAYFFDDLFGKGNSVSQNSNVPQTVKNILIRTADARIYQSGYNNMYDGDRFQTGRESDKIGRQMLGAGVVDAGRALRVYDIDKTNDYRYLEIAKDHQRYDPGCMFLTSSPPPPSFRGGSKGTVYFGCIFLVLLSYLVLRMSKPKRTTSS